MKNLIILISIVFICSCHKLHEGNIVGKYIVPAHSYKYTTVHYVGKVPITTLHTAYVEDEYVLVIDGYYKKELIEEEFSVSKNTYQCMGIGNHFNDTIPCEIYEVK